MAKELSEKDLEAVELDDDLLEFVNGGLMAQKVNDFPEYQCSKCKHPFSLGDFGYEELGLAGSISRFQLEHESTCNGDYSIYLENIKKRLQQ